MMTFHSEHEHDWHFTEITDYVCGECGIFQSDLENKTEIYEFTKEEVESLWRILSHHYISYEDVGAIEVIRKLSKLIDEILAR